MENAMKLRFAILGLAAMLGACAPSNNIVTTRTTPSPNAIAVSQQLNDMVAATNLKLGEVRLSRTQGGVLKAEVELMNQTSYTQRMAYRFEWFDASGVRIDSMQSQLLVGSVAPGGVQTLTSVAPSEKASDFRLQMLRR
jgi:hypothetical protein